MQPRDYHMAVTRCGWTAYPAEASVVDSQCLADIPDAEVLSALVKFRQEAEHSFPPSPGELRKILGRSKGIEARTAWEHVRSLPRCPASNSVERYTDRGKAAEAAWKTAYADPRVRAGLRAVDRFGGLSALQSGEVENARKAFCGAFMAEADRGTREFPPLAPADLLGFGRARVKA